MAKFTNLDELYNSLSIDARATYEMLCDVTEQIKLPIKKRLFAGQLAFYLEETLKDTFHSSPVIVISFYEKHANVFASKNEKYQPKLNRSKLTKNNTLQIDYSIEIDRNAIACLFKESLY